MNRFKALYTVIAHGGQAVRVSPGDELWPRVTDGPDIPLSARELARHWAVTSIIGQLGRGLRSIELDVVMRTQDRVIEIADQSGAQLLRPHLRRISDDVHRFGEFLAVIAADGNGTPRELVPLPADEVTPVVEDGRVTLYRLGSEEWTPERIFRVGDEQLPCSPIETLRPVLEEDIAASDWRRDAWQMSPRGIVERPAEARDWSQEAMERFSGHFAAQLMGKASPRGRGGLGVPVLEEGMAFKDAPLPDASSAQFIESRRLCAEMVADVYGVQGSLLATGADKQLGPARRQLLKGPVNDTARMIRDAFDTQLASRLYGIQAAKGRLMLNFDVDGAIRREEEDASVTAQAVGRPWRTPNEQRELEGRAPLDTGDVLGDPAPKAVVTQ